MLNAICHLLCGLLGLLLLGIRYRCRFGNAYWKWRRETAFGADAGLGPQGVDRWWAILDFGAWAWRIRRL